MFDSAAAARAERPGLLRFMFLPIVSRRGPCRGWGRKFPQDKTFPPIGVVAKYAQLRFRLSAKTPPACLRLSAALSGGCLRHAPAGAALLLRFPPGPLRWVPAGALSRMGSGIFPKQNISPHPLRRRMGGLLIDGIVVQWSIPRAFFKLPFSLGEETGGTLVSPILKTSGTRRF